MTLRMLVTSLTLGCSVGASAAGEPSRAEAVLQLNGKLFPLTSVLVIQNGNEEGMADGPRLLVFLSDKPILCKSQAAPRPCAPRLGHATRV
ncbi:MAG: hypothetical protein M3Y55_15290 [Pseudomonadota bacterium]|nr:hypothetical protein [Pseudomonadota bacterium]